ncbi:hypothetical protein EES46_28275 [Streptomyces sp. ADI98-10]|nr:hypothetical protein EES46_28275 [Streptomyces sp. ADI98-10]
MKLVAQEFLTLHGVSRGPGAPARSAPWNRTHRSASAFRSKATRQALSP